MSKNQTPMLMESPLTKRVYFEGYSDGSEHRWQGYEDTDWQAIANELNAELGIVC